MLQKANVAEWERTNKESTTQLGHKNKINTASAERNSASTSTLLLQISCVQPFREEKHQKLPYINISVCVCLFGCIQCAIYNTHPNNERRLCIQPSSVGVGAGWQQLGLGHARWRSLLNMQSLYQIYVLYVLLHFLPHFFSLAIESYIYETDSTLDLSQKYH